MPRPLDAVGPCTSVMTETVLLFQKRGARIVIAEKVGPIGSEKNTTSCMV